MEPSTSGSNVHIDTTDSEYSDSESLAGASVNNTPPKKKRRICCFREEWLTDVEFKNWISRDSKDTSMVKCNTCCSSFSIKTDGVTAVKKHASSDKHRNNFLSKKMSKTLNSFFCNPNFVEKDQIIASELALTYHGVQHQHSYLSQDCGNKLNSKIFSDSKISSKIACGRTKAEALVENVLGPHSLLSRISAERTQRWRKTIFYIYGRIQQR